MFEFLFLDRPLELRHLGVMLGRCLVQLQADDNASPQPVLGAEAAEMGGFPSGLVDSGWLRYVDLDSAEMLVQLVFSRWCFVEATFPGDAARLLEQGRGEGLTDIRHSVAHD